MYVHYKKLRKSIKKKNKNHPKITTIKVSSLGTFHSSQFAVSINGIEVQGNALCANLKLHKFRSPVFMILITSTHPRARMRWEQSQFLTSCE